MADSLEKIVSLCKRRGFVFPGSEIYGGLKGTWDYGPLGSELKFNIKQEWWNYIVRARDNVIGLNTSILMNPKVWEASGHTSNFNDPLVECKICHERIRADQKEEIKEHEQSHKNKKESSPTSGVWTEPQKFNLLVETFLGVVEGKKDLTYLRGEITQGVHVNFKNVLDSTRVKIPFGIAQIGKAFRNEITPGNFIYRSREFEQMELQYYISPDNGEAEKIFEYWKNERMQWYLNLGINKNKLRFRQHKKDELAHYAKDAWDIEYETPFGWKECEGIHNRGDWDLSQHQKFSGQDLSYFDRETGEKYIPWVIETSSGVERPLLYFLLDSYTEEDDRAILKLHPKLAPYKAAVFPLLANKPKLVSKAKKIYQELKAYNLGPITFDDRGNIGKRYYSQDEIGTPYCITVDFQTLEDDTATIRDRDSMKQERVKVGELKDFIIKKIS